RDKLTDIAAPIHGKPKYELASEDLREQQRFRRFRRLAITALAILTILSVVTAGIAFIQRREAIRQRNDAVALRLATDADAIFKRLRGGTDDRALQELTVAARLSPVAARGGILSGLQSTSPLEKIIRTPRTPQGLRVTPDGKRLITGSNEESVIRIWDIATGQQLSELTGQTARIVGGLTADGKHLLTYDWDASQIGLWDLDTGRMIRQFEGRNAVMSADGTRIAAIRSDKQTGRQPIYRVEVWNTDTAEVIRTFPEQPNGLFDLALSPDGRRAVTLGADRLTHLWNVDTGEKIGEPIAIIGPRGPDDRNLRISHPEFSPDGRRFAAGVGDRTVRQWDAFTGVPLGGPITGHTGQVSRVAYSPDGTRIASGGDDATRVWNAETGVAINTPLNQASPDELMFSPNGQQIVSIVFFDRAIRVWRAAADSSLSSPLPTPAVNLPKDAKVAGLAPGHNLPDFSDTLGAIWNLENDRVTKLDDSVAAYNVTMTPDGRRAAAFKVDYVAATRTARYRVQVWDLQTGRLVSSTDQTNASTIAISPDGTRVAVGAPSLAVKKYGDRPITMFDADTGKRIDAEFSGLEATIKALRFSPDSRQLVAANGDQLRAWDAVTGKQIGDPWGGSNIYALAFSPDGRLLASGGLNTNSGVFQETISIWDAQSHQLVGEPLTGHNASVKTLDFSSDGRLLASGSGAATKFAEIRIWDVASRQQLGEPLNFDDSKSNSEFIVAFSTDATSIFASQRKSVWRWPGPARWPDLLCDKLSANMSRKQWKQWVSPDIDYVVGCPDLPIPES
ncbi:WD40 repeat domain-containing protein, partial [Mycobacteroides saopaulense]